MSVDVAQFHQVFFEESREGLDVMEQGLLGLDVGAADPEVINAIFRAAHSIKGGSGTFGFAEIAEFTHVLETLLDEMRAGKREVTQAAVDVLLQSVDCLRGMFDAVQEGAAVDRDWVARERAALERLLAGGETPVAAAPVATETAVAAGGWRIGFRPHPNFMLTGNDPLRIIDALGDLGPVTATPQLEALPAFDALDPEQCLLAWNLELTGEVPREAVTEIFEWVEDECDLEIAPLAPPAAAEGPAAVEPEPGVAPGQELVPVERRRGEDRRQSADRRSGGDRRTGTTGGGSIRVEIDKIDSLINMVGELVITQSMLSLLGENFEMGQIGRLQEGLAQLERHTRELQESVMRVRMLPISFVFSRFPRLVRDLSAQLGKQVELKISGEGTELDKTVIEQIGDPLVHLVRNSLDHGIERPEVRRAAGKPETGTLHLNAYHRGGSIVIEITDDGAGLNRARILAKAAERGLVSGDENLPDEKIYELIMQPGFSTAETITDVSGRGVGMDVVRKNIQSLGGNIEIRSEEGRGSTFTIRLPLTLAILDGQTVSVGDEWYIVPLMSIVESIQIGSSAVKRVAGRGEVFKLRDEYVPVLRMAALFGVESARARALEEGLLVVVEGEGRKCGLFVDELLGQQQVVIKSLEANFRRVEGISGATILGDGSVALILDIPGLMRLAAA